MQQVQVRPHPVQNVQFAYLFLSQKESNQFTDNIEINIPTKKHQLGKIPIRKALSDIIPWSQQEVVVSKQSINSCIFEQKSFQQKQVLVEVSKMGFAPQYVENILKLQKFEIEKNDVPTVMKIIDFLVEIKQTQKNELVDFPRIEREDFLKQRSSENSRPNSSYKLKTSYVEEKQQGHIKDIQIPMQENHSLMLCQNNDESQVIPAEALPPVNISEIECLICMGKFQYSTFGLPSCNHVFCKPCVEKYLENSIMGSQVIDIKCPFDGCKQLITEEHLKMIISGDMLAKYYRFRQYKEIENNKNARWCPKIGCTNYVVGNVLSTKLTCQCGQELCFKCGNEYHPNQNCEEAMDQNYLEARIKFKIKPCPKCKAPIQKSSGCNHMTCYKCQYNFCWLCNTRYSYIHYREYNPFGCCSCNGQYDSEEPCASPATLRAIYFFPRIILLLLILPCFLFRVFIKAGVGSCCYPYRKWKKTSCYDSFRQESSFTILIERSVQGIAGVYQRPQENFVVLYFPLLFALSFLCSTNCRKKCLNKQKTVVDFICIGKKLCYYDLIQYLHIMIVKQKYPIEYFYF